jgi:uncharacterized spore protein YtfJ
MSDDLSRVLREAQEAARGHSGSFIESLAERVGAKAGAGAIFGAPVERDGVTVIPVAKVRWGFGGGSGRGIEEGSDSGEIGEGSGGGGGMMASPIGFIELSEGRAEFRRVHDPASAVPIILAAAFAAWVALRGLKKIVRG